MEPSKDKKTRAELLSAFYQTYTKCNICPIGALGTSNIVYGCGNPEAQLMFIGEAPGEDEDRLRTPFVGRSGKLLNAALNRAGIQRADVFITNVLKCRPPQNRTPFPEEIETAKQQILSQEIAIIQPKVICTLGSSAANAILEKIVKITQVRGNVYLKDGVLIVPTYHPAYILRNMAALPEFEKDIQKAIALSRREDN